jgi:hypothetical protein
MENCLPTVTYSRGNPWLARCIAPFHPISPKMLLSSSISVRAASNSKTTSTPLPISRNSPVESLGYRGIRNSVSCIRNTSGCASVVYIQLSRLQALCRWTSFETGLHFSTMKSGSAFSRERLPTKTCRNSIGATDICFRSRASIFLYKEC